ncbi:Cellulose biosynthesis protein BcsR [Pararobbsia alpina]|uniref:cellulose biosynthesis protein BcsP n=1 Tax=Pararobbsia alpina TaxID=621374 RepID=UPI0039A4CCA6
MSTSEDVQNLFGKFDGKSQQYQEVARDDQAVEARSRWPLLSSLALSETDLVPDVADNSGKLSPHTLSPSGAHGATLAAALASAPAPAPVAAATSPASTFATASTGRDTLAQALRRADSSAAPHEPSSTFSPPRAPQPAATPLPFVRGAAPAFRVHTGPAADEPTRYPPVVTADTSKLRPPSEHDFAPPVVPVNKFKPSATPITGVEADAGRAEFARPGSARQGSILGKLFAPAPSSSALATQAGQTEPRTRDLGSVFSRLAGRGGQGGGEGA